MRRKLLAWTAFVLIAAGCSQPRGGATKESPSPSAASQTVLDLQGSSNKTTARFTVPAQWGIGWTFDCRPGLTQNGAIPSGAHCTFLVTVRTPDGNPSAQNPQFIHQDVAGQGVATYHTGGTFYLSIEICCTVNSWSLKVITLPGS